MIRQLKLENLDQLVPLFNQYMVFYGKDSAPRKYENYLHERIASDDATVFVAFDAAEEAIGFVLNYRSFSSVSLGSIVVLNDLYVVELERSKGIGKQLIERVFDFAKESGAVRVDLGTAKTNQVAQGLYEKIGFVKDTGFYAYSYDIEA